MAAVKTDKAPRSVDERLREFGFAIHERRKGFQAKWSRRGKVYLQRDALKWVQDEIKSLEV